MSQLINAAAFQKNQILMLCSIPFLILLIKILAHVLFDTPETRSSEGFARRIYIIISCKSELYLSTSLPAPNLSLSHYHGS